MSKKLMEVIMGLDVSLLHERLPRNVYVFVHQFIVLRACLGYICIWKYIWML